MLESEERHSMTKRLKKAKVSETVFYPIQPTAKGLIAYVSFTYEDKLRINDVAIYTRPLGGYRLAYPVKLLANGKSVSSVYPITKEVGNYIEDFLLAEYEKFIAKVNKGA